MPARPDEASDTALDTICSGRVVPSNRWRAAEVVAGVAATDIPEAAELREAFRTRCPPQRG